MVHNQNTSSINKLSSIENLGTKLEVLKLALKQVNMSDSKNQQVTWNNDLLSQRNSTNGNNLPNIHKEDEIMIHNSQGLNHHEDLQIRDNDNLNRIIRNKYSNTIYKGVTIEMEFESEINDTDCIVSIMQYSINLIKK